VFQSLHDGKTSDQFVVFADGFAAAHKEPGQAAHRPTGLAVGPDGSLYIADDNGGRIWRVTYRSGNKDAPVAAAAPFATSASVAAVPPEGLHPAIGLSLPPGGSLDQIALGDRIFHGQANNGTCAGCHGSGGKGTAAGPDLTTGKYVWSDGSVQAITETITRGVPKPRNHIRAMPPNGGVQLSQTAVAAVASYVWAIGHTSDH
jgi:mono/diheme cytochrome c family protein